MIVPATGRQRNWRRKRGESVSVSGETAGGLDRHQRNLQLLRERRQHVAHGDEAHVDQNLAELVAALALQFERAVEILLGDQLALDQDLAQPHYQNSSDAICACSALAAPSSALRGACITI